MNNILNLYNIELKRIYKWYLGFIGLFLTGNILLFIRSINAVVCEVARNTKSKPNINLMKLNQSNTIWYEFEFSNLLNSMNLLLGLAVIFCLMYALVIWYRDFIGRDKIAYTLFMLPYNKFNIYIAKAITVIIMIYGVILTQIVASLIGFSIIKVLSNFNNQEFKSFIDYFITERRMISLIQPYFTDFIMINVLGVILAVVVIFTGVMIQKSFKIPGIILACVYIFGSIYLFFITIFILRAHFTDQYLMIHGIYYLILFTVSISISYVLLNKKVYV